MCELYEPNKQLLELIAQQVRCERPFRQKIGGSSLVPSLQSEIEFWTQYANDPSKRIVVAHSGEKFIGFFALDEIDHGAQKARAHVHFWQQSKTLPKLCQMFWAYCRDELGLIALWGMTSAKNAEAWNFAQRIGFKKVGTLPHHYRDTQKGWSDCYISHLNLTPELSE